MIRVNDKGEIDILSDEGVGLVIVKTKQTNKGEFTCEYSLAEFKSVVKDTKSNTKNITKSISIHSD